ncbi:hypothetical protein [Altererythrobacter sp.]|uniref:hypothetical protein n=1 Tax=Altererythrobacter sp. TaxID=1872480 RepID=UPI003CFE7183
MTAGSRLRQIGWAAALLACLCLFLGLSFRVHAVKSEVQLAERQIIALKRETMMLETEFETRASQRQLADWNAVEFGYQAPRADQFLENERQLASLGSPRGPGAPSPIRVARAETPGDAKEQQPMVSPLTGKPVELAIAREVQEGNGFADAFGELLSEASPVRSAQARTMLHAEVSE